MSFWLWVLVIGVGLAVAGEIAFRVFLRLRHIAFSPPKTHRHLYVAPHPYLPYAFRPDTVIDNRHVATYPLHAGRFEVHGARVNNYRILGEEDIQVEKKPGTMRVLCLGGSTTANSLWEVGNPKQFSYPRCLREALRRRVDDRPWEVLNCGMGGWTSAEILVDFALHQVDLKPDVVVLYNGFNDLEASLTAPFASDYSHSRRNFGEVYARIRLASYIPNLRFWKSYAFIKGKMMGFGNVRYDLLSSIRAKKASLDNPFMGLDTERRNVEHLIHLCKANQIQVVLSTFAYHLYAAVTEDRRALKYRDGVFEENAMVRELAKQHGLPLVDIAALIPDDDAYFVDSVHFTPAGMQFLGERFADCIAAQVSTMVKAR
jgi:lysophospholipase L1-like esterase